MSADDADDATPLSGEELAALRYTLAHEHDPPRTGRASSMAEAIQMRRDGYDAVTVYDGERATCHISNGGNPRVMWDWDGPRLLATLDVALARIAALEGK